jgi:hypothetical protein
MRSDGRKDKADDEKAFPVRSKGTFGRDSKSEDGREVLDGELLFSPGVAGKQSAGLGPLPEFADRAGLAFKEAAEHRGKEDRLSNNGQGDTIFEALSEKEPGKCGYEIVTIGTPIIFHL